MRKLFIFFAILSIFSIKIFCTVEQLASALQNLSETIQPAKKSMYDLGLEVEAGKIESIKKYLLDEGGDPNYKFKDGKTFFSKLKNKENFKEIATLLLKKGGKPTVNELGKIFRFFEAENFKKVLEYDQIKDHEGIKSGELLGEILKVIDTWIQGEKAFSSATLQRREKNKLFNNHSSGLVKKLITLTDKIECDTLIQASKMSIPMGTFTKILEKGQANINCKHKNRSPLHTAVFHRNKIAVGRLLYQNANKNLTIGGETAYELALRLKKQATNEEEKTEYAKIAQKILKFQPKQK